MKSWVASCQLLHLKSWIGNPFVVLSATHFINYELFATMPAIPKVVDIDWHSFQWACRVCMCVWSSAPVPWWCWPSGVESCVNYDSTESSYELCSLRTHLQEKASLILTISHTHTYTHTPKFTVAVQCFPYMLWIEVSAQSSVLTPPSISHSLLSMHAVSSLSRSFVFCIFASALFHLSPLFLSQSFIYAVYIHFSISTSLLFSLFTLVLAFVSLCLCHFFFFPLPLLFVWFSPSAFRALLSFLISWFFSPAPWSACPTYAWLFICIPCFYSRMCFASFTLKSTARCCKHNVCSCRYSFMSTRSYGEKAYHHI